MACWQLWLLSVVAVRFCPHCTCVGAQQVSQDDRFEVVRHSAALVPDLRDGLLFDRQYLCVSVKPMPAKARDLSVADCGKKRLWRSKLACSNKRHCTFGVAIA